MSDVDYTAYHFHYKNGKKAIVPKSVGEILVGRGEGKLGKPAAEPEEIEEKDPKAKKNGTDSKTLGADE